MNNGMSWLTIRKSQLWVASIMGLEAILIAVIGVLLVNPTIVSHSWLSADSAALLALSIAFIGVALIPFVLSRRAGQIDWFEIIYILSGAYVLNFALRGIYDLFTGSTIGLFPYSDMLVQAQLFSLIGFVCMLLGYYLPFARRAEKILPIPKWRWPLSASLGKVALLYAIGLGARLVLGLQNVSVTFQYYLLWLGQLTAFAFAIAIMYAFVAPAGRWKWRWFVLGVLPLQVLFAFLGRSNKFALIEPIYLLLISFHYFRKRISLRAIALPLLIVIVVFFPIIAAYRGQAPELNVTTRLNLAFNDLTSGNQGAYGDFILVSVMNRSHLLDSVALVIKYAPVPDWSKGLQYYLLTPAYAFVPRALWPDKPIGQSIQFGQDYLGLTGDTSIGISNPGDLYANLGFIGIVVGLFLLGFLYRLLYTKLISRRRNAPLEARLPYFFIYFFVLEQLYLTFEVDVASGLSELLKKLVLLGLVAYFIGRKSSLPAIGKQA